MVRAALAALFAFCIVSVSEARVPESPEDVLSCVAEALTAHDIDAYAALLHEDYAIVDPRGAALVTRAQDIELTGKLFADTSETSFDLTGSEPAVHDESTDTWAFRDVHMNLHVVMEGRSYRYRKVIPEVVVTRDTVGNYVVLSWTEPRNE